MEVGRNQIIEPHFDKDKNYEKHTTKVLYELRKLQEKKIKPTDVYGSKFKNYKKKFNKK